MTMAPRRVSGAITGLAGLAGHLTWTVVRLGVGSLLVLFEPILRIVLCTAAFGACFVALLFGFVAQAPGFPAWGMLGLSVAALSAYWAYLAVIRWVIGGGRG